MLASTTTRKPTVCSQCKCTGHNKRKCPLPLLPELKPFVQDVKDLPTNDEPSPMETSDIEKMRSLAESVLDELGAGHTESVYHNAMKIGLQDMGLQFETERDILISFRGRYVGTVRADLVVEKRLVVELKAATGTETIVSDAEEQCRIYMKETRTPTGVVIVFPKRVGGKLVIRSV
jgi:GxxExxY protein